MKGKQTVTKSLQEHFSIIKDHRQTGKVVYPLDDLLVLCVCAIICGAEGWSDIEEFGHSRKEWLNEKGLLKKGIPVDDTIARAVSMLNPKALQSCFINWMVDVNEQTEGDVIAIDGKTLRRSFDRKSNKAAIHMVSAFACANGLVLGQAKTAEKSNEITAIPALLTLLDLKGHIVTIDAMGCQKKIAKQIIEQGGDYTLALKDNQKRLHDEVKDFFDSGETHDFKCVEHDYYEEIDKGHGRLEVRRYWITNDLSGINERSKWSGLNCIGMAENETHKNGKITIDRRYYILSIDSDAKRFGHAVRNHWGIENRLHWVLDMSFREDESRVRRENAAENFSVFRHVAVNLLRKDKSSKRGIKGKRLKAALNIVYAESVCAPIVA